jgi:hypothetical protein
LKTTKFKEDEMRVKATALRTEWARFHLGTLTFVLWLIGWPVAIVLYRATHVACGPAGLGPGGTCTPAEDYYPTLYTMVLAWFAGLIAGGFIWIGRRAN